MPSKLARFFQRSFPIRKNAGAPSSPSSNHSLVITTFDCSPSLMDSLEQKLDNCSAAMLDSN
ncbi:aldehyde dehydrogenase family 3 member H1-like protein [Corchorus olitorius]|uniref:Aldehyde dehydrogenase family 3 member H1-like protein n=1 Tax=Corchorus olitorius TaxID=93759 RepID=A0A1R3HHX2_9ROSI|nr:aldehyde dehydrogenase family 3 member H1-like protein [Corchorus olitorius]